MRLSNIPGRREEENKFPINRSPVTVHLRARADARYDGRALKRKCGVVSSRLPRGDWKKIAAARVCAQRRSQTCIVPYRVLRVDIYAKRYRDL